MLTLRLPTHDSQLLTTHDSRLTSLLSRPIGWLDLPSDHLHLVPQIKDFVKKRKAGFDKIICLGMGGSALGIVTLQKALFPFDDRLTVVDNLDATTICHLLRALNPKRTLVLVVSKSGETLETLTQFQILKQRYAKQNYEQNFIILTDPKKGALREIATRDRLTSFPIPPDVGGRFSVLSCVGLLPLALLGGSLEQLLKGARAMKVRCLEKSPENPALQLAHFIANSSLLTPHDKLQTIPLFTYSDHLYPFGLWYQQLLAESIGKSSTVGLTPLPLRGASDQHSVLQLLQDGPNDKLTMFLTVQQVKNDVKIPGSKFTVHETLNIEAKATEQALAEDGRPTVSIMIDKISEFSLGELFMLFEMQVAILGELFHVNAFDQPGVEKSKKIVKTLLK